MNRLALGLLLLFAALATADAKGIAVSVSPPASRVGEQVMAKGGNGVDAAVAVGFALAVTWPEAGNIGGGGFMLVRAAGAKAEPVLIDYRETAPPAATRGPVVKQGPRPDPALGGPGAGAGPGP